MKHESPPSLDAVAARRWLACPVQESPWLHEEVGRRMAERLDWIRLRPKTWLDWGPLRGGLQAHDRVAAHYPDSRAFVAESLEIRTQAAIKKIAKPWWSPARWRQSLVPGMPPPGAVEMVWANMALHADASPQTLLARWHQALAPNGFLMFSCLGPDTLRELRSLYAGLGWPQPSHDFTDMHDWGDMLVEAGYAEPVMDVERITLSFETPARLLQELRGVGRNLHRDRFTGLRGRVWLAALEAAMRQQMGSPLTLSFEIIYGHALKPPPRVKLSAHSAVSLQDMRAMLQSAKP